MEDVKAETSETYAFMATKGVSTKRKANDDDEDSDDANVLLKHRRSGQHRFLTTFEREHFHPLIVHALPFLLQVLNKRRKRSLTA